MAAYKQRLKADSEVIGSSSGSSSGGSSGAIGSTEPLWLVRNHQAHRRTNSGSGSGGTQIYEGQLRYSITANGSSYVWRDKQGNTAHYNDNGQLQSYSDRNSVRVSIVRNTRGDITQIKDHHGNTVITYAWEVNPSTQGKTDTSGDTLPVEYRLKSLTDYTGRVVTYHYDDTTENGALTQVTDVRNKEWHYGYTGCSVAAGTGRTTGCQLISQTDPDNRATLYRFASDGSLKSRLNADGVGNSYSYSFDSSKEQHYRSRRDSTGTVTETWYNEHGMQVRQDINGENQFSATVVLSDDSSGVSVPDKEPQQWW